MDVDGVGPTLGCGVGTTGADGEGPVWEGCGVAVGALCADPILGGTLMIYRACLLGFVIFYPLLEEDGSLGDIAAIKLYIKPQN